MLSIDPKEISTNKLHGYLLGAVAPRPIAFASTMDADGNPNLSPFSFFNVFGAKTYFRKCIGYKRSGH